MPLFISTCSISAIIVCVFALSTFSGDLYLMTDSPWATLAPTAKCSAPRRSPVARPRTVTRQRLRSALGAILRWCTTAVGVMAYGENVLCLCNQTRNNIRPTCPINTRPSIRPPTIGAAHQLCIQAAPTNLSCQKRWRRCWPPLRQPPAVATWGDNSRSAKGPAHQKQGVTGGFSVGFSESGEGPGGPQGGAKGSHGTPGTP